MNNISLESDFDRYIENLVDYAIEVGKIKWATMQQDMVNSTSDILSQSMIKTACTLVNLRTINKMKQLQELEDG